MGCTVIAIIYSPIGLLVTHIGDGRAGYCDTKGDWHGMMEPFRDKEGGTAHIAHPLMFQPYTEKDLIKVSIVNTQAKAFCLMSDGCEFYSFELKIKDGDKDNKIRYKKPNKPHAGFFDPIINQIIETYCKNEEDWSYSLVNAWKELLNNGNGFANENDYKTMILGVFLNNNQDCV